MPAARDDEQRRRRCQHLGYRRSGGGPPASRSGTCGCSSASPPAARAVDLVARLLAESLRSVFGQTVVVDPARPYGFG